MTDPNDWLAREWAASGLQELIDKPTGSEPPIETPLQRAVRRISETCKHWE